MEKKSNALVRHLAEMPPAAIYALADKRHLFTGFELAKKGPVSGLNWSADGSTLTVRLFEGQRFFEISLSLSLESLSTSCDCGLWSPRGCCPHLVATLATLKKALSAAALPMLKLPQDYLEMIRKGLRVSEGSPLPVGILPLPPKSDAFSLELLRDAHGIHVALCKEGVAVTVHDTSLPAQIREFLRLLLVPDQRGSWLEIFQARFGDRYPIVYKDDERAVSLTVSSVPGRRMMLRLDVKGKRLCVSPCFEDGSMIEEGSFINDFHHFSLKRGVVERMEDLGALYYLKRFTPLVHDVDAAQVAVQGEQFSLSLDAFNDLHFTVSQSERGHFFAHAFLLVRGAPRVPRQVRPGYRLNIVDEGDEVALVAEGIAEESVFFLSPETFWFFPASARAHFPQPLRAKKRIAAVIGACFSVLSCHTKAERDKAVRLALDTPDFLKRGVKAEARRLVNAFWQGVLEPRFLLLVEEGEWIEVPVEGGVQARLLEIPYHVFGPEIFSEGRFAGEMVLPRDQLLLHLSHLRRECAAAGFEVCYNGEPLKTVSWSFTVDATRSSIDWFELRPEIRCDGELVEEEELLQAMQGGGLFQRAGGIMMLDEESSRALSLFAAGGKRQVVRIPRLQILDWIVLRKNGVRVLLSPEDEKIIDSLTNFERIEPCTPPALLRTVLRRYQQEGLNWLAFLYEHRFGACLADDMGLGKTIQAIAFLAGLKEEKIPSDASRELPHLVVVPPSLIFNWESEIARFYPELKVLVYRGQGRRARFDGVDVVLTSYGVIQRDSEELAQIPFHVIVFDEAQAVKNIHAETTGAVRRLKGRFKVALTGTPVENHLGEFYSVIDLALPGLLGPFDTFRKGMAREGTEFLETLIRRTRPFVLRRSKDMIADELPPKVETDIYLEMSPRQKALYVRTVAQVKATVEEAYRLNAPAQARVIALTAILKLRQICLSTKLLLPDGAASAPKVDFLIDQLEELFDEGHSVLVFSQFTSFLDVVQEALSLRGTPFSRLDGSTPVARRKTLVEGFQASEKPSVFLLSLKAGGRGLNLTRASYVFHLDPWWNPAVENQASDRAHRIGQKNQVTITRLLMRHSIEEKMMELKKRKLKLYHALLEEADGDSGVLIGREDFEFLLS